MEYNNENYLEEELEFEAQLAAKIEARQRKKKEKDNRVYANPVELHRLLKEHVIMRKINSDHIMSNALGRLIIKIVDEYSNGGQYRGYYNGWKYEMKSRAYEHICRYAHGYDINFVETNEFFIKWLFRSKESVLEYWFNSNDISYAKFRKELPEKIIKTPNGKEKTKIGKYINEKEMLKVEAYNPVTFKDEIFSKYPHLVEEFHDQKMRNSFNYITTYAYHAFIAVIKEENKLNDAQLALDDKIRYDILDGEDKEGSLDKEYTQIDETMIDWSFHLND